MKSAFPFFLLLFLFSCSNQNTSKENDSLIKSDSLYEIAKNKKIKFNDRLHAINAAIDMAKEEKLSLQHLKFLSNKTALFAIAKKYDSAIHYTDELLKTAVNQKNDMYTAKAYYKKGQYFRKKNVFDTAYLNYKEAEKLYLALKDTLNIAKVLRGMSNLRKTQGDFYGSQSLAVKALKILPITKETRRLRYNLYMLVGISSNNLSDFDGAFQYYNKALKFSHSKKDSINTYNSRGINAEKRNDFSQAIIYFEKGLSIYKHKETQELSIIELQLLDNLTFAKGKNGMINAVDSLLIIRELKTAKKNLPGVFASTIHIAELYFDKQNYTQVEQFSLEALNIGKSIKSPDAIVESLGLLIESKAKNINEYAIAYKRLTDSIRIGKEKLKNTFDAIEFETLEKEKEIIRERQKTERGKNRQYWILGISILVLSSLLSIYFFLLSKYRMQKLNFQQNKIELNKYILQIRDLEKELFDQEEKVNFQKTSLLNAKDFQDYVEEKYDLTRHNFKIFKAIALGLSRQEFSLKENKSENTVKTWRNNLFEKLKKETNSSGRYSDLKAAVLYYQELLNFKKSGS